MNERTIPGEGIAPVRGICHAIAATGYAGFWDIELFSEQHWAEDDDDLLQRCQAAFADPKR